MCETRAPTDAQGLGGPHVSAPCNSLTSLLFEIFEIKTGGEEQRLINVTSGPLQETGTRFLAGCQLEAALRSRPSPQRAQ